ncbi:Gfo/Idh/MocA family protein [Natronospora cellulosivora (SeqCode)]
MDICIVGASGHANYAISAIAKDENSKLAGIAAGTEGENLDGLLKRINNSGQKIEVFHDYKEMLDILNPDILVVNSYFNKQAEISIEALNRGMHVFVEKPIATNLEDLALVRDAYQKASKKKEIFLASMFGIRYTPWFMTAWKHVQQGKIGKVRLMNAQKSYRLGQRADFYKNRETYGGTIPWVASHAIDWLYWFAGEKFTSVYASHSKQYNSEHGDLEMTGMMHFNMENEIVAAVNVDYLRPGTALSHGDDRIRLAGTDGVVEVRDDKVYLINSDKEGMQELELEETKGIFTDFLEEVRGESPCLINAEDSFYITEVCLKARKSADENKLIVLE